MEIAYSRDFIKSAKLLPLPVKEKLADLIVLLRDNHFHPLLHTKPLAGKLKWFYSFRITRDWRAIFKFVNSKTIHLIDVSHRKDIYK